jgi:hypothetical protein
MHPEYGNYHDYATFNDGGINNCIRVMIKAYQLSNNGKAIEKSYPPPHPMPVYN